MHPFSINYLTSSSVGQKRDRPWSPESVDSGIPRTPSPSNSSASSTTKSPSGSPYGHMVDSSVADALMVLEKHAASTKTNKKTDEKPPYSYIALISMAILQSPSKKMLLSDIYQYFMDNFPYYNNQEKAWRNSVRHNLSLNECFIKCGRADNGKGNFWAIHPACVEDFSHGDFRRRQARQRARRCNYLEIDVSPISSAYIGYGPVTSGAYRGYRPYTTPYSRPYGMTPPMTSTPVAGYGGHNSGMFIRQPVLASLVPFVTNGMAVPALPPW